MNRIGLILLALLAAAGALAFAMHRSGSVTWHLAKVVNRPDGAALVWNRTRSREGMSLPLWRHHRSRVDLEAELRAFSVAIRRGGPISTAPLQIDVRWKPGQDEQILFPRYLVNKERVLTHNCVSDEVTGIEGERIVCGSVIGLYDQVGNRAEAVYRRGSSLVFAAGLDGRAAPCAVDLSPLGENVGEPVIRRRTYVTGAKDERHARFAVSYLPPHSALVADYGGNNIPIYRVRCTGIERLGALLENRDVAELIREVPERLGYIEIVDMVPSPGSGRAALLVRWAVLTQRNYSRRYAALTLPGPLRLLPERVQRTLGSNGGLCRCTGFWASDPGTLLVDLRDDNDGSRAELGFRLLDLTSMRERTVTASHSLSR